MERTFTVVVKVSEDDHARLIRTDIMNAIRLRTPEFYISSPLHERKTIEDYFNDDEAQRMHKANR